MNATTTTLAGMEIITAGYRYKAPKSTLGTGFYEVTTVETGRKYHVLPAEWRDFIETNDGAIMGYIEAPAELLKEVAINESGQ